jgi:hypothetical protein
MFVLGPDSDQKSEQTYMHIAKEIDTCIRDYDITSSAIKPEFILDAGAEDNGDAACSSSPTVSGRKTKIGLTPGH